MLYPRHGALLIAGLLAVGVLSILGFHRSLARSRDEIAALTIRMDEEQQARLEADLESVRRRQQRQRFGSRQTDASSSSSSKLVRNFDDGARGDTDAGGSGGSGIGSGIGGGEEDHPRQTTPIRRPSPPGREDRNNNTTNTNATTTNNTNNATTTTTTTTTPSNDDPSYTCTYAADSRNNNNRTTVVVPYGAPTFVVIGVQKAGTTVLLHLFRDHPDILVPYRELHFFQNWNRELRGASEIGLNTRNGNDADTSCYALDRYMTFFERDKLLKSPKKLYAMEKTPMYITDEKIVHRMRRTVPWTKLLVILRNPVDRLYSHYKMTIRDDHKTRNTTLEQMIHEDIEYMRKKNMTTAPLPEPVRAPVDNAGAGNQSLRYEVPSTPVPFDHAILNRARWDFGFRIYEKQKKVLQSMVGRGLYGIQLEHWLRSYTIGTDLLVLNYDDLKADTKGVYERILGFVGIPLPAVGIDFGKKSRADDRKNLRPLSNETRRYLAEFYAPYNARLESLLGPAWSPANLGWD